MTSADPYHLVLYSSCRTTSDNSVVRYQGSEMRLSEAYKQFAASLFQELNSLDAEFSRANQFRSEIPVAQ